MSLDGAYEPDNIFAKILRGEIPCHRIMEDDDVLSFMDAFPQSPGHCLVVPKAPARNLFDISPDALSSLITRVQTVARAVREALQPDGVVIMQFNGAPAGQTVFHLHFHIIPRYEGRQLAGHGQSGRGDDAELAQQAQKIATALSA